MATIEQAFTFARNLLKSLPVGAEQKAPTTLHLMLEAYRHPIVLVIEVSAESQARWLPLEVLGRLFIGTVSIFAFISRPG